MVEVVVLEGGRKGWGLGWEMEREEKLVCFH